MPSDRRLGRRRTLFAAELAAVLQARGHQVYPDQGQGRHNAGVRSVNFPQARWSIMRSAYEEKPYENARQLMFKTSSGAHGHLDVLGITAYAYGRELLIDPGIRSYEAATASATRRRCLSQHDLHRRQEPERRRQDREVGLERRASTTSSALTTATRG